MKLCVERDEQSRPFAYACPSECVSVCVGDERKGETEHRNKVCCQTQDGPDADGRVCALGSRIDVFGRVSRAGAVMSFPTLFLGLVSCLVIAG